MAGPIFRVRKWKHKKVENYSLTIIDDKSTSGMENYASFYIWIQEMMKSSLRRGKSYMGGVGVEKESMEQHAEEPCLRNNWKNKFWLDELSIFRTHACPESNAEQEFKSRCNNKC